MFGGRKRIVLPIRVRVYMYNILAYRKQKKKGGKKRGQLVLRRANKYVEQATLPTF